MIGACTLKLEVKSLGYLFELCSTYFSVYSGKCCLCGLALGTARTECRHGDQDEAARDYILKGSRHLKGSCSTLKSLLAVIRAGTHLTSGLVLGDTVIVVKPGTREVLKLAGVSAETASLFDDGAI